jgi:phosphatidate cytidylyltransferase
MFEAPRPQLLLVLAGVVGVLVFADAVSRLLQARAAGGEHGLVLTNLAERIRSWWVIVVLVFVALLVGGVGIIVLFAAVSAMAVGEFIAHAPLSVRDPPLDTACYALVALQYTMVVEGNVALVTLALPVAALIVLPLVAVSYGGVEGLQSRIAHRIWWVAIAGWCLSFVPALLILDVAGYAGRNALLVLYVIIVTQGSDVLQYVFGKLLGRRAIAPRISPDKTIEGFVGGIASASAIGTALSWMTPFTPLQAACVSLLITLLGFLGGLLLSGIKRDLRIKNWGDSIRGHGGVLDRVDSLVLPAPGLFYLVYAMSAA